MLWEKMKSSALMTLDFGSLIISHLGALLQAVAEDLHWLRHEGGIDAVRLPVGFWCLDEFAASTPMMSTQRYVDAVCESQLC